MDAQQKAAFIMAQAACASIEAVGMVATNQEYVAAGRPPPYRETDFERLINKYGIHQNAVVTFLND